MLRACYSAQSRIFYGGDPIGIRWYFCEPDAPDLGIVSSYGSAQWLDPLENPDPNIGEVIPRSFSFDYGKNTSARYGLCHLGEDSWFDGGPPTGTSPVPVWTECCPYRRIAFPTLSIHNLLLGSATRPVLPISATPANAIDDGTANPWTTTNYPFWTAGDSASVVLLHGAFSSGLQFINLGFALPADGIILGVEVSLTRYERAFANVIQDYQASLCLGGARIGAGRAKVGYWPTIPTATLYGSAVDGWSASLTPAIVNDPTFGFAISARNVSGTRTETGIITSISLTVYWKHSGGGEVMAGTLTLLGVQALAISQLSVLNGYWLALFSNDREPLETDTIADYVETVGDGYARQQITGFGAVYLNGSDQAESDSAPFQFQPTNSVNLWTIAGVMLLDGSGNLVGAWKDPDGPFTLSGPTDSYVPDLSMLNAGVSS
jgi:hypothetical protein